VKPVKSRSLSNRSALFLRLLASAAFFLAFSRGVGWRWAVLGTALAILLVSLTVRSRGPTADGAIWSASADFLTRGHRFPGQLSLSDDKAIWTPNLHSERHGAESIQVTLAKATIDFEAGSAFLDVTVRISPDDGTEPLLFLTHRSARLREAARHVRERE
jgi:hypothetical protein